MNVPWKSATDDLPPGDLRNKENASCWLRINCDACEANPNCLACVDVYNKPVSARIFICEHTVDQVTAALQADRAKLASSPEALQEAMAR